MNEWLDHVYGKAGITGRMQTIVAKFVASMSKAEHVALVRQQEERTGT